MMLFKRFLIYLFIILCSSGCTIVTFYGTTPKTINSEIEPIRIYWNYWVKSEEQVLTKLNDKIVELLNKNPKFNDYVPLYQSNNSLRTGKRFYKIKFFTTKDEKRIFLEDSNEKDEEFNSLLGSVEFLKGWEKLKLGMTTKETFDLLPKLLNFNLRVEFQVESIMIYEMNGLKLVFDRNGRLMSWAKITTNHNRKISVS